MFPDVRGLFYPFSRYLSPSKPPKSIGCPKKIAVGRWDWQPLSKKRRAQRRCVNGRGRMDERMLAVQQLTSGNHQSLPPRFSVSITSHVFRRNAYHCAKCASQHRRPASLDAGLRGCITFKASLVQEGRRDCCCLWDYISLSPPSLSVPKILTFHLWHPPLPDTLSPKGTEGEYSEKVFSPSTPIVRGSFVFCPLWVTTGEVGTQVTAIPQALRASSLCTREPLVAVQC